VATVGGGNAGCIRLRLGVAGDCHGGKALSRQGGVNGTAEEHFGRVHSQTMSEVYLNVLSEIKGSHLGNAGCIRLGLGVEGGCHGGKALEQ
jgi:hypothetical protein